MLGTAVVRCIIRYICIRQVAKVNRYKAKVNRLICLVIRECTQVTRSVIAQAILTGGQTGCAYNRERCRHRHREIARHNTIAVRVAAIRLVARIVQCRSHVTRRQGHHFIRTWNQTTEIVFSYQVAVGYR